MNMGASTSLSIAIMLIIWFFLLRNGGGCRGNVFNRFGVKICNLSTGYVPGHAELRYNRETGELFRVMQSWVSADDGVVSYAPVTRMELELMIQEREKKLERLKTEYVTPTRMINSVNRELSLLKEAKNYNSLASITMENEKK